MKRARACFVATAIAALSIATWSLAQEAYWNEPIAHSVENLGKTDIHNLIIELKPAAACH